MSVSDVGVVLSSVRVQSSESVGRREAAGLTRISNGGLAHPPFKLTAQWNPIKLLGMSNKTVCRLLERKNSSQLPSLLSQGRTCAIGARKQTNKKQQKTEIEKKRIRHRQEGAKGRLPKSQQSGPHTAYVFQLVIIASHCILVLTQATNGSKPALACTTQAPQADKNHFWTKPQITDKASERERKRESREVCHRWSIAESMLLEAKACSKDTEDSAWLIEPHIATTTTPTFPRLARRHACCS